MADEEWGFVAPYPTLNRLEGGRRMHDLRAVVGALRCLMRACKRPRCFDAWGAQPAATAMTLDSRAVESTPRSGVGPATTGPRGARARKSRHAVGTWCYSLALRVTAASEPGLAQVVASATAVHDVTGQHVVLGHEDDVRGFLRRDGT